MFTRKKVNDYAISVPKIEESDKEWKGMDCLDIQYFVMAILGKRRSGKSTLIYSILKYFATTKTVVIFFCPTFAKDPTYKSIRMFLQKKGITYTDFQSIENEGVNNVSLLMKTFEEKTEDTDEEKLIEDEEKKTDKQNKKSGCKFKESPTKENKKKVKQPEFIIIFDDISQEIKNKAVNTLCKNSRHYKAKVILASQSITDIHPHTYAQLDYCAVFKNFNNEQIKQIYERIQPDISIEEFQTLYTAITNEKDKKGHSSFMFVDRANTQIRENLNCVINKK